MTRLLDDPEQALLVAQNAAGAVVGWVHVRILRLLELEATAQVASIVVDERRRGAGIGRALMAEAERWAVAQGCEETLLYSNAVRADAHRFYEGLGYQRAKMSYRFHKRLKAAGRAEGAEWGAPTTPLGMAACASDDE